MTFSESTNWHDAIAPGEEVGKAERQLDAAITDVVSGTVNSSGLQVIYIGTSSGTVANTTDETTVIGATGVGSVTLPADFFQLGVVLRVTARGYYSSAAGTANLRMRMDLGTTTIINTGDFAPATATNQYWEISALVTCRLSGVSGEIMPSGHMSFFDGDGQGMITATLVGLDTTVANDFDLTAEWDVADASNKVVCTNLTLEKMQVGNGNLSPDDVTIEFLVDSSVAGECAVQPETVTVTVVLTLPEGGSQLPVAATVDWTATNTVDTPSGTVTFPAGATNGATQLITIAPDYTADVVITLSNVSSNAVIGVEDTHTIELAWIHKFDFTAETGSELFTTYGQGGWTINIGRGVYTSGVGFEANLGDNDTAFQLQVRRDLGANTNITQFKVFFSRSNGEGVGPSFTGQTYYGGSWMWLRTGTGSSFSDDSIIREDAEGTFELTGEVEDTVGAIRNIEFRALTGRDVGNTPETGDSDLVPDPEGAATLTRIEICGYGTNPFAP